ncbi:aspartic peptidase domain-containing protein [Hygrophoropsis aurantiaca]|uniref:Aspartic peptidase domain-containing protein n=1 Tax=Hygrophoropsis aurantiaca TaxID=72124 RepID=A0ACB8AAM6_9AGAM|nr:aspartic peptidase domain-containing protein [Hygrophoropsis aurantiaca]
MMTILSTLSVVLALLPYMISASPSSSSSSPSFVRIPLSRPGTSKTAGSFAHTADALRLKHGYEPATKNFAKGKRDSSTEVSLQDIKDLTYYATITTGTPPQSFDVLLDTGTTDFWIGTEACTTCGSVSPLFDTTSSSSFKTLTSAANITYNARTVSGMIAQDTITLGSFTVAQQTFPINPVFSVAVNHSTNTLANGISGIMGLAFRPASAFDEAPFWENLVNNNQANNVMSFHYTRAEDNPSNGGAFVLGGTDSSLYIGQIEYQPVPEPQGPTPNYWQLPVTALTVQGKSISVPTGNAIIDTGSPYLAAPTEVVQSLYAEISGSQPLTGSNAGFYAYPCSTDVQVTISFGGTAWAINPKDMNLGTIDLSGDSGSPGSDSGSGSGSSSSSSGSGTGPMSGIEVRASSQMCVGGIFDIGKSDARFSISPSWIIGNVFLKNVYTVLEGGIPPNVGFAKLAGDSSTQTGTHLPGAASSNKASNLLALLVPVVAGVMATFF